MKQSFIALTLLPLFLALTNCSPVEESSTDNPFVEIEIAPYTLGANKIGTHSVTSLEMCIQRLRFKATGSIAEEIDLRLGQVRISSSGTSLGGVDAPIGRFDWVEFDLDNNCFSGKSLILTNSNGTFASSDLIRIRFDGEVLIDQSSTSLTLFMQDIVNSLNMVTSGSQIRNAAESATGLIF